MNTELSLESFIRICSLVSDRNFRRPLDVFELQLASFSDEFITRLDELWFELRYPGQHYSPAVTVVALREMRALIDRYITNTLGDFQVELRNLERDAGVLRDRFAEKFNDPAAAQFETDLMNLAHAAAEEGHEVAPKVRGAGVWSIRPSFEKALATAGFSVERDSPLYDTLFDFFKTHFDKGFNDPFPRHITRSFEQDRNERDPSLN